MTSPNASPTSFFSLGPELRTRIYELVLYRADVIGTWSSEREEWPDAPVRLSAQLLRTYKQIHAEGLPILYGKNTFEITISNTFGPYSRTLYCPEALEAILQIPSSRDATRDKQVVVPHLRRFSIQVRYTSTHKLSLLRDTVRRLVWHLQTWSLPRIALLRLECQLNCGNENEEINWRHPCWDDYEVDGDREECIGVLRTWLGSLRNVDEVVIEGLPDRDTEILQERLQTRSEEESSSRTPSLIGMYTALERYVGDISFCEEDLTSALVAAEHDDREEFKACKDEIYGCLKRRWEAINREESLWQW
jgi:hypothetical protein